MVNLHCNDFVAARPSEVLLLKAADLLFEIGRQCLHERQSEWAVKNLSKAISLLDDIKDSCVTVDVTDLAFNTLHTYGPQAQISVHSSLTGVSPSLAGRRKR
jgi:hypothetical protein